MANVSLSPKDFRDEVFESFDTYWADRTPISWPNLMFDPESLDANDQEAAWTRIVLLGRLDQGTVFNSSSVEPNSISRNGTVTIEVHVRMGTSTDLAYELAGAALQWLQQPDPDVANSVFSARSAPIELGPDGTWYTIAVSASWVYFSDTDT